MSAADRMAVRMSGGEIRSVPRRVGLAMIASSRAKHAPQPATGAVQVVTAESPALAPQAAPLKRIEIEVTTDPDTAKLLGVQHEPDPDGSFQAVRGPVVYPDLSDPDDEGTKAAHAAVEAYNERYGHPKTALPIAAPAVERPKGNAGRESWAQYAQVHGVEVTDEMGRNEIRDAVVAKLETDRMSQPAFTDDSVEGGRLATPEDEPVTESLVTHADPGERTA